MPQKAHDMVDAMLADPEFMKGKPEKARKSSAWAIAMSKMKKKKQQVPAWLSSALSQVSPCSGYQYVTPLMEGGIALPSMLIFDCCEMDWPEGMDFLQVLTLIPAKS